MNAETKEVKIEHYNSGDNLENVITDCLESEDWMLFCDTKKLRIYFINRTFDTIKTTRIGSIKAISPFLIEKILQRAKYKQEHDVMAA